MPGYRKKYPIRKLSRLFKIFGVQFPEDMPKLEQNKDVEISTHAQAELRHMPGMMEYANQAQVPNTAELRSYLTKVAKSNNDWVQQADAIKILTPEIDRSAEIMVSSIMSPTDMQSDTINVICDGTDLGSEIETKVGEELTNFFNDKIELGDMVYRYIRESLYGSGSCAILILPPKNIDHLNNAIDNDLLKAGVLKTSKKNPTKITADNTMLSTVSTESAFSSTESLFSFTKENTAQLEKDIEQDLLVSLEASNPFVGLKPGEVITKSKEARDKILGIFRDTKSHIVMSSDLSGLRRGKDRLSDTTGALTSEIEKHFLFDQNNPTFLVDTELDESSKAQPSIIEVPTRAVVPVIIPGSPDKHIGYFILVDQWGNPVMDGEGSNPPGFGPKKLTEAATQAAFGAPNLYRFGSNMTDEQRFDITNTIFGITFRHLMENKLEEFGLTGTTIGEYDSITACIFRNLLVRKKCVLVFVPEPLMVYFRFQHRPDGTGKSITEGLNTLLALRTVLVMSYIMAATENSVDNKIISVNVDEKQSNIQQYLDMVRNAYIAKKMMRFDINPLTVQQDLIQKSLTILPKGIKGLSDSLDVQTEHRSTGAVMPDDNLLEKLTNWLITALEVPHSALNHTSENEYSRSVASTNLHFSNNVKGKQKTVIKHTTKFIRLYTKYSPILREKICNILKTTEKTEKANASTEAKNDAPKSKIDVEVNEDTIKTNLVKIVNAIKITLPSPKIAINQAQYDELSHYLDAVEKVCDSIYNDDMLAGEKTQDLGDTLKMMKASVRSSMIRDYIDNIGFQSTYEIPYPEDINMNNIRDLVQLLSNQRKGIQDWMTFIVEKAKSDDLENPNSENQNNQNNEEQQGGGSGYNEESGMDEDYGVPNPPDLDEMGGPGEETPNENEEDFNEVPEPPNLDKGAPKEASETNAEDYEDVPPPPSF